LIITERVVHVDGSTLTNTIDCRVEVDLSGSFDEKSAGSEI
jgi:hypothetical protein